MGGASRDQRPDFHARTMRPRIFNCRKFEGPYAHLPAQLIGSRRRGRQDAETEQPGQNAREGGGKQPAPVHREVSAQKGAGVPAGRGTSKAKSTAAMVW